MGALDFLSDYFSISTQKKKRKPMQVFMSSCPLCVCVCLWWFVSSKFAFYFPFNSLCCRQLKSRWKWTVMAVKEEFGILFPTCQVVISAFLKYTLIFVSNFSSKNMKINLIFIDKNQHRRKHIYSFLNTLVMFSNQN